METNIRSLRNQLSIRQKDLARMVSTSVRLLSKWERGLELPSDSQFKDLAKALNCDAIELQNGQIDFNRRATPGEGYTTKIAKKTFILERQQPIQTEKINVLDLFCGAGGLSYGFDQNSKFQVTCGVDLLEDRVRTFHANHPNANGVVADIRKFSLDELAELSSNPEIIVGGAPCQGFSSIRPFRTLTEGDNRNSLFEIYVLILAHLKPKWFVFENVVGLLTHKKGAVFNSILEGFADVGYQLDWRIINGAYYGLPQNRERLLIIGNSIGKEIEWPRPTHYIEHRSMAGKRPQVILPNPLLDFPLRPAVTIMEAIHDLEEIASGETKNVYKEDVEPTPYELKLRNGCIKPSLHQATSHSEKMLEIIRASGINRNELPEGTTSSGFSSSYSRLEGDKPSTTITVNFVHPASNRCIHPKQDRALSIQEGARLQGFPDSYKFIGTKTQIVKQIGNAVPPILSEIIAKMISQQYHHSRLENSRESSL